MTPEDKPLKLHEHLYLHSACMWDYCAVAQQAQDSFFEADCKSVQAINYLRTANNEVAKLWRQENERRRTERD